MSWNYDLSPEELREMLYAGEDIGADFDGDIVDLL